MMRIHLIIATRPNLMKMAPVYHALAADDRFDLCLVHTGQHYDSSLSDQIIHELNLPDPDINFGVGSGPHASQTARVMLAYEDFLAHDRPDLCVVPGDVNSTLACALTAAKRHVPVAHVEAGLRNFDMTMPEEINRKLTDQISTILWTPSDDADANLRNEGLGQEKITRVGNCMIDSLVTMLPSIRKKESWKQFGLKRKDYGVATLHRPSNVDDPERLLQIVNALLSLTANNALILPLHPRTRTSLETFGLLDRLEQASGIHMVFPLGYLDFISLVEGSRAIITDSGGIQEETTSLGIPCLTVRPNTERPITCTHGTNRLIEPDELESSYADVVSKGQTATPEIPLWDGSAGTRIATDLTRRFHL